MPPVSLTVDLAKRTVTIRQVGINASGLNGFALEPNRPYSALHGDIIEVLHGKYAYEVRFEPAPVAEAVAAAVAPAPTKSASPTPLPLKRTRSAEKQARICRLHRRRQDSLPPFLPTE